MPRPLALIAVALLGTACAVLISCGGDEPENKIPRAAATELIQDLNEVQANLDTDPPSFCVAAEKAEVMLDEARGLGESVDAELRDALVDSVQVLIRMATDECLADDEDTETTETETNTTDTTTTDTTTTDTTTTTTPTTTPEPPPPPDNGGSGGVGPGGSGL